MAGSRKTRDGWAALASKFEASGKTAAVFCRENHLSATTFKWWRWRLRSERKRVGAREDIRLIAVDVKPSSKVTPARAPMTGEGAIRIALLDMELSFAVGTDVGYVAVLVENLRSRC